MSRPYRKILADYHRQFPHQVRLRNTGDWRFDHCSRAHYQFSVFGFKTAEQAAAFQRWTDTSGIDWSIELRAQPLPHPEKPPERPFGYGPSPPGR